MSFDEETGEPWRCSACVWYVWCRIGRCVGFLPLEMFIGDLADWLKEEFDKTPHESSKGPGPMNPDPIGDDGA